MENTQEKRQENHFPALSPKIQQGFFPLLLSFKPCWVHTCKFHPQEQQRFSRENFPIILELFSWQLSVFYPKIDAFPSLQADTTGSWVQENEQGEKRKTNPPPGSQQILRIPNFSVPGGRPGCYRSLEEFLLDSAVGYRNCRTPFLLFPTLLDHYYPIKHIPFIREKKKNSSSCAKFQLWSLRKMGFSCWVYGALLVNSNSGSVKLFLGAPKIHSRLKDGIVRNQFLKKYRKKPNQNPQKEWKNQSTRIRKILFPALAAFLVGIKRIPAGFVCLDPVRKMKLADFGPSLTLKHKKYKNKAFSGPTSTSTKVLRVNEVLRKGVPGIKNLFSLKLCNSEHFRKTFKIFKAALNTTWALVQIGMCWCLTCSEKGIKYSHS